MSDMLRPRNFKGFYLFDRIGAGKSQKKSITRKIGPCIYYKFISSLELSLKGYAWGVVTLF
jgi:hypothetical protein